MTRSSSISSKAKESGSPPARLASARAGSRKLAATRRLKATPATGKQHRPVTTSKTWSKAKPIVLDQHATVDDALAVIVTACRDHWRTNQTSAEARHPEGTHQVRVALRRLRSALSAFKKYIPPVQKEWFNTEAKWLLSQLGVARDLDVFIDNLTAPVAEHVSENAELAQVMRAARALQTRAHESAAKALRSPRATRLSARLDAWVTGRGWRLSDDDSVRDGRETTALEFAQRLVNRRLRNIREDYKDVDTLTVLQRHELRIAVKKIRYNVEFFHTLLPAKRAARLSDILKDLQDNLGHLNDISVAERTVASLVNDAGSGLERRQIVAGGNAIGAWHKHAARTAEPETAKLWRKFKKVRAF
jgi:triphosphatase